jgi:hypothetical protein
MKRSALSLFVLCFALIATASAAEFSADMAMVISGQKSSGKIFYKNTKTNRQEIMGMISIYKHPVSYMLFAETKRYVINDIEEQKKNNPMVDVDNYEQWFEKNNMKKVGKETIQDYQCIVYEGDLKVSENQPPMAMKFWYSTKLGYPIKIMSTLPAPLSRKMTSTLENIEMGKQPDSLFEIPSGYTEAKSMQEAMGMGGFPMPVGGGTSETPSREDVQKMMKSVQEKMKGAQGR